MCCQLLFLSPWAFTRDFPVDILAKLNKCDRIHLRGVSISHQLLVQIRKSPFLSHNQLETGYHTAFWRKCMGSGDRRAGLKAKLGIPRCEMGAIACYIEFDFVVCFQYLTWFGVARKLNHK